MSSPEPRPYTHSHAVTPPSDWGLSFRGSFFLMAVVFLCVFSTHAWMKSFSLIFVSIVLEALPFMLLGSIVSGFVEVFVSKDRLAGLLPKRRVALTFVAAGMGVVFPVCECAIVPVVRRLLRKGVPLSAAVAYLLAGPIFNPVVGASTAVAYASGPGWSVIGIVGIRLAGGFLIALVVGLVMGRLFPGRTALKEREGSNDKVAHAHDHGHPSGTGMRILSAFNHGVDDFLDVGQYLVLGAFVAGFLQTLVSREAFLILAGNPLAALPAMMLLAFLLNLCSEADAFIAASFRGTLPLSAQMTFMVLGPMLDMKLILMYLTVFRKRTIVVLSLLVVALVFILMLLLHGFLGDWYSVSQGLQSMGGA